MKCDDLLQLVGNTPHVLLHGLESGDARVYAKLEGYNPTGSIKDRACLKIIRSLQADKQLQPGMTLLDASSGNMACSIAFCGKMMGYPTTVVANSKLTIDKRNFINYFGATLLEVGNFTIDGNRACRDMVEQAGPGHYCFLDQLHNWANPQAHYETTGPEIIADFPQLAMLVGSLGSGGALCGTAQFLKEARPEVKVVAVQAASGAKIPGAGSFDDGDYITPFIKKGFSERLFDDVYKVDERAAARRTLQLKDQGIFTGLQTGAVLHAALECISKLKVAGDVVLLSGDTGWKNLGRLLPLAGQL
jgi:cysteine synthase